MEKKKKIMIKHLEKKLGKTNSGLLLAIVCDALDTFTDGVECREIRNINLTLNNFFSFEYDFKTKTVSTNAK